MKKKIVLFSDGTGNSSAKAQKTNVWRLFQALDQRNSSLLSKYDDGVGTSSNKYLAILGGTFGWGLKRNVIDLYKFVCRNYQRGDEIYGFGFSRGAFTIRLLVGLIAREGLVPFHTQEELDHNAAAAYRQYRSKAFPSWSPIVIVLRWLRDAILRVKDWVKGYQTYSEVQTELRAQGRDEIKIRFLGLWDTVEAYGLPIAELKRGIDWVLWPMLFGDFKLSPKVDRACHALSIDDERTTFHPLLWDEAAEAEMVRRGEVKAGRITQVWFAGVHSNVGGGYPEDRLSLVPLEWIMREAKANDLPLDDKSIRKFAAESSPFARLYDSRAGFAAYYRYGPRRMPIYDDPKQKILPIVHGSVIMRMAYGSDQYAPIILPSEFWVAAPDGELLPMEGFPDTLRLDATKQKIALATFATKEQPIAETEKTKLREAMQLLSRPDDDAVGIVWDTAWWRRLFYLVTVLLTAVLVAYPWTSGFFAGLVNRVLRLVSFVGGLTQGLDDTLNQADVGSRGFIIPFIDALSAFIPSYAAPWTKALLEHPIEFSSIVIAILLCLYISVILQYRIHDRARVAWREDLVPDYQMWMKERRRGARNGMLLALAVALLLLIGSLIFKAPPLAQIEIGVIVFILALTNVLSGAEAVSIRNAARKAGQTSRVVESTFALRIARSLRSNPVLTWLYRVLFRDAVPIAFALGLVVAGAYLCNRVLFDAWGAAGQVCSSSIPKDARKIEKTGTVGGFSTNSICWPTGLVLEQGRRYRITVATPGDWMDRTTPTGVNGFPTSMLNHWMGLPLRRWWTQNWFKPIAQIGAIGNDQYLLDSSRPEESSVPKTSQKVVTVITARATGELFIFVNDAVLMIPGMVNFFYRNNAGTGTIALERIEN
jgi:uncharacterized protein (DUF2235 family)